MILENGFKKLILKFFVNDLKLFMTSIAFAYKGGHASSTDLICLNR